jgi:hypothetical protein
VGQLLIGRDLFKPEDRCTLDQSGKLTWSGDQSRPRFVVLGAGGYGIDIGGAKKFKKRRTTRNESSILSLLYWPDSNRASYWTGGDGYPSLTKHLAQNVFPKAGFFDSPIKVIKLDHHGASAEFNGLKNTNKIPKSFMAEPFFTMASSANPSKVIVTPGDGYGHPCKSTESFETRNLNC